MSKALAVAALGRHVSDQRSVYSSDERSLSFSCSSSLLYVNAGKDMELLSIVMSLPCVGYDVPMSLPCVALGMSMSLSMPSVGVGPSVGLSDNALSVERVVSLSVMLSWNVLTMGTPLPSSSDNKMGLGCVKVFSTRRGTHSLGADHMWWTWVAVALGAE